MHGQQNIKTISHAEILILQLDSCDWYAQNNVKVRSRSAHGQVTVGSRSGHCQVTFTSRDAHVKRKQARSLQSLGMAYVREGHQSVDRRLRYVTVTASRSFSVCLALSPDKVI